MGVDTFHGRRVVYRQPDSVKSHLAKTAITWLVPAATMAGMGYLGYRGAKHVGRELRGELNSQRDAFLAPVNNLVGSVNTMNHHLSNLPNHMSTAVGGAVGGLGNSITSTANSYLPSFLRSGGNTQPARRGSLKNPGSLTSLVSTPSSHTLW